MLAAEDAERAFRRSHRQQVAQPGSCQWIMSSDEAMRIKLHGGEPATFDQLGTPVEKTGFRIGSIEFGVIHGVHLNAHNAHCLC